MAANKSDDDTQRTIQIVRPVTPSDPRGHQKRASLLVVSGWEIGREIMLDGDELILGRSPLLPTPINLQSISRQHCSLARMMVDGAEQFRITDLGSTNGTLVNGVHIDSAMLQDGDRIQAGDVILKFVVQDLIDAAFYQEIHRRINHDEHTGLLKLDAFRQALDIEINRAAAGTHFVLSMTDMDGLKKVNDTHGHLAGSGVVKTMGRILRESVRDQDLGGLYGGDEAILLYKGATLDVAGAIAERIRQKIEGYDWRHNGRPFQVSISQGLAEWPRHGLTATEIIAAADRALYEAKRAGRNCVRTADE